MRAVSQSAIKKNALLPELETTAPYFWVVLQATQYVGPAGGDSGITRAPCVLNQDVGNGFTGDEDDRVAVFSDLLVTLAGDCRRCNQVPPN